MSGGIRFGHSHAAVLYGGFQSVLHGGGVGSQRGGQLVVEHIAGKVIDAIVGLVSFCVGQADGRQYSVAAVGGVKAIQHTDRALTVHHFVVHGDIGNTEISELHALNGVLAQLVDNRVIVQAGGNIGLHIPRTLCAGRGDVVFVDAQERLFAGVNGRLGKSRSHQADDHERRQQQRQYTMDLFHLVVSSVKSDFLQK